MSKNRYAKQKHYVRLSLVERKEIQESLNKRAICSLHSLADTLQRSCSTVYDEVKRNRSYARGSRKGQVVEHLPEDVCEKLTRWPFVCNSCRYFHYLGQNTYSLSQSIYCRQTCSYPPYSSA